MLSELIESVKADPPRGEIVVVIGASDASEIWSEAELDKALAEAVARDGVSRASGELAKVSGWKKRDIYKRALSLKTDD
jgi:16S rRNA (cytidine1402-2'-O)-methyltransferase